MSVAHGATTHDIIIVGGGTAGSVLANRLSRDRHVTVVVIEVGTDRSDDTLVKAPGASPSLIGNSIYDWGFKTTEQVGISTNLSAWPHKQ